MQTQAGLERALSFINCHVQPAGKRLVFATGSEPRRVVTISRQKGSGAHAVAEKLAAYLQARGPKEACPWTVFDRNLVQRMLQEHNLPQRMGQFVTEDRMTEISDTLDELFGLHPPSWTLVRQMTETILHLAEMGNVILVGRGAAVVTAKLDYAFHVRFVSSLEKRIARVQELEELSRKQALAVIHREDRGRARYLKKYFDTDPDNPLLYHLTINTDLISYDEAARMIGDAVLSGVIRLHETT
jgi:cytidylate kinase